MKKATHTGRLNGFKKLFNNFKGNNPTLDEVTFLYDVSNKEHKLIKRGDCFYLNGLSHDLYFTEDDLTDLKEIKPQIEIPETPFWIDCEGSECVVVDSFGGDRFNYMTRDSCDDVCSHYYSKDVSYYINNGIWEIVGEPKKDYDSQPWECSTCNNASWSRSSVGFGGFKFCDKCNTSEDHENYLKENQPKKEMRAWGYEDFLEFWEDCGFCIPVKHKDDSNGWVGAFHRFHKTCIHTGNNHSLSWDEFCEKYRMLNGNKFEKEI